MGPVSTISESTEQTAKQIAQPATNSRFQQTLLSARRTMVWSEILKIALDSFRASKLRFALTALGMVIGTASVILVVTIGMTGKQFILAEIQKIGTNEIFLEYAGGGAASSGSDVYNDFLTRDDEKAVVAQVPGIMYSSPIIEMHDRISFGGGVVKDTLVLGVSPDYQQIRNLLVPYGRFIDDIDDAQHEKVAVVTETFAKLRYGSEDAAVGREFSMSGIPFTIIGVAPEGFHGTRSGLDYEMWMPITMYGQLTHTGTWMLRDRNTRNFMMFARLAPGVSMEQARGEVQARGEALAAFVAMPGRPWNSSICPAFGSMTPIRSAP